MKVVITGANGFIGSKMFERLENDGYEVEGWDRLTVNDGRNIRYIDMSDTGSVNEALESFRPDIVIHCAGSADVGKSIRNPESDYIGNVTLTHHLLFGLHEAKLDHVRFVFLSSAAVYGNPAALPITEDMQLNPLSPYALHKVMCEDICQYFAHNYDMDIKIARIFSAYGKGLKKQIFWDMYNKYRRTGKLEMLGTGKESRDYIHVDDVIQALRLLATTESKDIVFNVANGEEITIRKATEEFAGCLGMPMDCISFNGVVREGDPLNWKADVTKIEKLGYHRSIDMEHALREYIEWAEKRY